MLSRFNTPALLRMQLLKTGVVSVQGRDFGAKKKKIKAHPEDKSDYETIDEPVATPAHSTSADNSATPWRIQTVQLNLSKSLF